MFNIEAVCIENMIENCEELVSGEALYCEKCANGYTPYNEITPGVCVEIS